MQLDDLFANLHQLPNVPKVAQDLILQFDNPNTSVEAVARNIALDPVISARVLRLANSARFRGARESTSVEDAALRLGFNTLRTLVLASAFTSAFKTQTDFDLKAFWYHSFLVASICRPLAKQVGADVETAFTCGMLHDIGELLIQTGAPHLAGSLGSGATSSPGRAANETLQLGFGYPEVGAELARRWQLPKVLQEAIAFQARPLQAPNGSTLPYVIAQSVALAQALQATNGDVNLALESVKGPLTENMDRAALSAALPGAIETAKAFMEMV
jgi:putative nucleotidyltransferase with HDIG domain